MVLYIYFTVTTIEELNRIDLHRKLVFSEGFLCSVVDLCKISVNNTKITKRIT